MADDPSLAEVLARLSKRCADKADQPREVVASFHEVASKNSELATLLYASNVRPPVGKDLVLHPHGAACSDLWRAVRAALCTAVSAILRPMMSSKARVHDLVELVLAGAIGGGTGDKSSFSILEFAKHSTSKTSWLGPEVAVPEAKQTEASLCVALLGTGSVLGLAVQLVHGCDSSAPIVWAAIMGTVQKSLQNGYQVVQATEKIFGATLARYEQLWNDWQKRPGLAMPTLEGSGHGTRRDVSQQLPR